MNAEKRRQLTALRKESKSANKERRKEIQNMIAELEASISEAVIEPAEPSKEDFEEQQRHFEQLRLKKAEKEKEAAKEREKIVEEARKKIQEGPQLDKLEKERFEELLSKANLSIHHINPDGNCLFEAIRHQLVHENYNSILDQSSLRNLTAQYILDHADQYTPFIDFDEHSVSSVQEYCNLVRKNGWWGGDVELDAMAHALNVQIKVFKSDGVVVFNEDAKSILHISFHRHQYTLGAHYNSLVSSGNVV